VATNIWFRVTEKNKKVIASQPAGHSYSLVLLSKILLLLCIFFYFCMIKQSKKYILDTNNASLVHMLKSQVHSTSLSHFPKRCLFLSFIPVFSASNLFYSFIILRKFISCSCSLICLPEIMVSVRKWFYFFGIHLGKLQNCKEW